jgi:hypothetical protein
VGVATTTQVVRLPAWWFGGAWALAALGWVGVAGVRGRGPGWLGVAAGIAAGLTIFAALASGQRVRVRYGRLTGHAFVPRDVDLAGLVTCRVGGNPLPGGARSNEVLFLQDRDGGRVTVPLAVFPRDRRGRIAALVREPVRAAGLELDEPTRVFLEA